MYRRPNLSFFLALSLACILAVFLEFKGDWRGDEIPVAVQASPARASVRVIPLEIAGASAARVDPAIPDRPALRVGEQTLEH